VDLALIDGFAVVADETDGAGPYNPLSVTVIPVRAGAAMPAGTDAVLPADLVEAGSVLEAASIGENRIAAGSQMRRGAVVFPACHVLRPHDVAVLADLDVGRVVVRFGLTVGADVPAILDAPVQALLWRDCGELDENGELLITTRAAPDDVWELDGIALRPGGTDCALGWRGRRPVLKLPADLLAFSLTYELLAARVIRGEAGLRPAGTTMELKLAGKIVSTIGLTDIVLVRVENDAAVPLPGLETGGAAMLARADGYTLVPAMREGFAPGDLVMVRLLGP
jgi:molybdopterin biosynthesis enzyme